MLALALSSSALLLVCASGRTKQVVLIDVVENVSWSTPLRPELHVLIRSRIEREVRFRLAFWGFGSSGADQCKTRPDASENLALFGDFYHAWSEGRLPPRGWTHRTIAMGGRVQSPCSVPYRIEFEDGDLGTVEGRIFVPAGPPAAPERWDIDAVSISVDSVVELITNSPDARIVRLLVENTSLEVITVSVMERDIVCPEGNRIIWSLSGQPPEQASIGPLRIEPKGWGVLVMLVRVSEGTGEGCGILMSIGASDPGGGDPVQVLRYRVALEGVGLRDPLAL
jgi:hypothetical protein